MKTCTKIQQNLFPLEPLLQCLDSHPRLPSSEPPNELEHSGQRHDQRRGDGYKDDDDDRGEEGDDGLCKDEVVEALIGNVVCGDVSTRKTGREGLTRLKTITNKLANVSQQPFGHTMLQQFLKKFRSCTTPVNSAASPSPCTSTTGRTCPSAPAASLIRRKIGK